MKLLHIILLILLLLSACSNNQENNVLLHADSLMETDIDSVFSILSSVDTVSFSDADMALYHLLVTKAHIYNDELLTDDSVISLAADYYSKNATESFRAGQTLYYQGLIGIYSHRNYSNAMMTSLKSADIFLKYDSIYWYALALRNIADICYDNYEAKSSLKYSQLSYKYFLKAKKYKHAIDELISVADCHILLNQPDEALKIYPEIRDSALKWNDNYLLKEIGLSSANAYYQKENYASAFNALEKYMTNISEFAKYGITILKQGKYDQVRQLIDSMHGRLPDVYYQSLRCKYYTAIGDATNLLDASLQLNEAYDLKLRERVYQSALTDVFEFHEMQKKEQERRHYAELMTYWMIGILIIVFTLFSFLFIYFRLRQKNKIQQIKNESLVNDIMELISDAEEKKKLYDTVDEKIIEMNRELSKKNAQLLQIKEELSIKGDTLLKMDNKLSSQDSEIQRRKALEEQLQSRIFNLFHDKWNILNMLCNDYYSGTTIQKKNAIFNRIEKEISKLSSREAIEEIKDNVNLHCNNVLDKIRGQIPSLSDLDIDLLAFLYSGFSTKAIILFLKINTKTFYTRRSRLKTKIENSDSPEKDYYLSMM